MLPYRSRKLFIKYLDSWYDGKVPLSTEPGYENWESELKESFTAKTFYAELLKEATAGWDKKSNSAKTKEGKTLEQYQQLYVNGRGQARLNKMLGIYAAKFPFFGDAKHFLLEKIMVKSLADFNNILM